MKYPVFVVEGPDNSGKTTLANQIVEKTKAVYLHSGYKFKGRMFLYHVAQMRLAVKIAETRPVVLDRWYPSELAYGNVYRNGPEPEYHPNWMGLHYYARKLGFSFTYCCPMRFEEYMAFCLKHYENRQQLYKLDEAKLNHIWRIYRDMWHDTYHTYDRDLLQVFSAPQDIWTGTKFASYILSQKKLWNARQPVEVREFIKNFTWRDLTVEAVVKAAKRSQELNMSPDTWRDVAPEPPKPVQGSFF
jgi:hypothetical protein